MRKGSPVTKWFLLILIGFSAGAVFAFYPRHLEDKKKTEEKEKRALANQQKESRQSCSQPASRAAGVTQQKTLPRQPHD
ncbi:MAG: hypothetical protein QM664_01000 [Flavihumibacter sp.]